jgi:hypothetical protein
MKQQKKYQEDLAKQGYLSVINFMAHVEKTAKKKAHMEQLVMSAMQGKQESEESEQESGESAPEELDTKALVSKCIAEVCCNEPLIYQS